MQSLLAYDNEPPGALFDQLVEHGIINRHGRVTKLLGGEADMEPWAQPPLLPDDA